YNDAHRDAKLAGCVARSAVAVDPALLLVGPAGSALEKAAAGAGLQFVREAFGDRRYTSSGTLVPRSREDSLLLDLDQAAGQVVSLARAGQVTSVDGVSVAVAFDTVCVHGDMPGAVERIRTIRASLREGGFNLGAVTQEPDR
ncbi:MAG: LamB/YcsF family protein, partial [Thermoanaerobaculia bacterium]